MTTDKKKLNLFGTVLTYAGPSSNYRGESEENRTVIQRITRENKEHAVVSPEAMRNALRETLATYGLPMNRTRLHQEDQLAVKFHDFPDGSKYADDFLFGFLVADGKELRKKKGDDAEVKRDSILRMNLAVALQPYRFNATFHQSPKNVDSPFQNAGSSALLHREVSDTAFQYPFALSMADCHAHKEGPRWAGHLLRAIGELNNVAGGHARSYFEFAPRSVVVRLTPRLVAGFKTYGFEPDGSFPELSRINGSDMPGNEFWLGGELVRKMDAKRREELKAAGVHMEDNPQTLLEKVAQAAGLVAQ
ncbi:MAG: type I-B CRISPR-associated protein Cas7/Cst2/DevR [Myxococcota bacterium]